MLCTHCDTRNDETARFCRVCGTPLATASEQSAAPQRRYTVSNAPMRGPVCPTCAQANPVGARFCVYCAGALSQPTARLAGSLQPAYAGGGAMPVMVAPVVLNVTNSVSLLVRAVWFVLIGWWLGLIWTIFAWLFNLTLIGLPVGLLMLHTIPQIMTLRPRSGPRLQVVGNGSIVVQRPAEHPLPLRAIWFVLVGWWASLLWSLVAWSFCATIILMPIAFWMFDRVPTITTLAAE